jgi:hypothetical protein
MTFGRRDGYYNEEGYWTRTKFCFVSCGERCTCRAPGPHYNPVYDKRLDKTAAEPPIEEDRS